MDRDFIGSGIKEPGSEHRYQRYGSSSDLEWYVNRVRSIVRGRGSTSARSWAAGVPNGSRSLPACAGCNLAKRLETHRKLMKEKSGLDAAWDP